MGCSAALIAKAEELTSSVWPSGVAFATMAVPIVPPAPVRFSITTACPQFSLIFCAMMRASVSVLPPGENGTTMRIGLVGNFCCAWRASGVAARAQRDSVLRTTDHICHRQSESVS